MRLRWPARRPPSSGSRRPSADSSRLPSWTRLGRTQKQIAYEQRLQAKSHQQLATCPSLAVRQSRQSHHAKGASVEQSKKELMAEAKQHQRHMRQVSHMFRQIDQEPIKRVLGADKQELTDKAILGGIHQFSMLQRFR
jgi:hypothetical protein